MGWAKYMEDNLDYIEEHSGNKHRYQMIYNTERVDDIWATDNYRHMAPEKSVEKECAPLDTLVFRFLFENHLDRNGNIICRGCGRPIPFPEEKRRTYAQRGWKPPKRCRKCKSLRETQFLMRSSY